jgi:uncharacterized paraquat-inducible protein A|tara:strand:- start:340 stop:756 length:417 start_codon:yes stop_codon:yes gene_type:complete
MIRNLLIVCESIFLCLGVYLPLATIDEFWIISSEFSILSLSEKLLIENEWTLGLLVFLFGVIFPIFKIITRLFYIKIFEKFNLHRFSMVDIFLLSFLVFMGKLSRFFEIELLIGFYFLLLSICVGYIQIIFSRVIFRK